MNAAKRSSRYAMISLILLIITIILTFFEVDASYEMKVAPDTTYKIIFNGNGEPDQLCLSGLMIKLYVI